MGWITGGEQLSSRCLYVNLLRMSFCVGMPQPIFDDNELPSGLWHLLQVMAIKRFVCRFEKKCLACGNVFVELTQTTLYPNRDQFYLDTDPSVLFFPAWSCAQITSTCNFFSQVYERTLSSIDSHSSSSSSSQSTKIWLGQRNSRNAMFQVRDLSLDYTSLWLRNI